MSSSPVWLDVRALEARLGVDRSTLFRWYKAGSFPCPESYFGARRRWRLSTIVAWEQAQLELNPSTADVGGSGAAR